MLVLNRARRGFPKAGEITPTFTTSHSPGSGAVAPSAANMADDDYSTYWASDTNASPTWIQADFGQPVILHSIVTAHPNGNGGWDHSQIHGAALQGSLDEATWDVLAFLSFTSGGPVEVTNIASQTLVYRYVRVRQNAWFGISEFNFT